MEEGSKERERRTDYVDKGKVVVENDLESEEGYYELRNKRDEGTSSWTYDLNTSANMEVDFQKTSNEGIMNIERTEEGEFEKDGKVDEGIMMVTQSLRGEHPLEENQRTEDKTLRMMRPEKKKGTWKRKTMSVSARKIQREMIVSLKRKADDGGGEDGKRQKAGDNMIIDVSGSENSLSSPAKGHENLMLECSGFGERPSLRKKPPNPFPIRNKM